MAKRNQSGPFGSDRYVQFDEDSVGELADLCGRLRDTVADMSPIMQRIAYAARTDAVGRMKSHAGWAVRSEATILRDKYARHRGNGQLGGDLFTGILPFWSAVNAGWATRDPAAHLFDGGTKQYVDAAGKRTFRYQQKVGGRTQRKSRASARQFSGGASMHQPARPFAYFSEKFYRDAEVIIIWGLEETFNAS